MRGKLWLIPLVIIIVGLFTMVPLAHTGWKHCKGTVKLIEAGPELAFDLDDWPSH
jgi:hypothetical protein